MKYFLNVVTKNYANFNGRTSVKEFWMFVLFNFIFAIVAGIIDGIMGTYFIAGIFSLLIIIPSLAASVRRLHDTGKSGWMILLGLIPIVGLVLIYFYIIKGDEKENAYGPVPVEI